jgi:hypothetical protein
VAPFVSFKLGLVREAKRVSFTESSLYILDLILAHYICMIERVYLETDLQKAYFILSA